MEINICSALEICSTFMHNDFNDKMRNFDRVVYYSVLNCFEYRS